MSFPKNNLRGVKKIYQKKMVTINYLFNRDIGYCVIYTMTQTFLMIFSNMYSIFFIIFLLKNIF